ncbi:unnamed protein product [Coregonus sp. 'balchen']|nr:unnamed protein product [Coregonus sp. 'balchen']
MEEERRAFQKAQEEERRKTHQSTCRVATTIQAALRGLLACRSWHAVGYGLSSTTEERNRGADAVNLDILELYHNSITHIATQSEKPGPPGGALSGGQQHLLTGGPDCLLAPPDAAPLWGPKQLQNLCESLEGCPLLIEVHLTGNPLQQEISWKHRIRLGNKP